MSTENILVAIKCFAYNHEPYIRETLDGFVSQKTSFRFVAIVHDDASTDNTAKIILEYAEKYPGIIKPIIETENQYSKHDGSLRRVMEEAIASTNCKYIALCEGDDYWIDNYKLQKQVDYLESHSNIGMVYSDFNILDQQTGKLYPSIFKNNPLQYPSVYPDAASFVVKAGYVAPPSWLYRKECYPSDFIPSLDRSFVQFTHFLATSQVYGFNDTMVTYRKLTESASHSKDLKKMLIRAQNILDTQLKLIDRYNLGKELKDICILSHYKSILSSAIELNRSDIVDKARIIIQNKSLKEYLLFAIYDINPSFLKPLHNIIRWYHKLFNSNTINT